MFPQLCGCSYIESVGVIFGHDGQWLAKRGSIAEAAEYAVLQGILVFTYMDSNILRLLPAGVRLS